MTPKAGRLRFGLRVERHSWWLTPSLGFHWCGKDKVLTLSFYALRWAFKADVWWRRGP